MTVPALWLKHRPLARAIARDWFIPGAEPQDVQQEAEIALWVAARDFDGTGVFKAWARMVIERHLIDCVAAANRGKHTPLNDSLRRIVSEGLVMDATEALPHLHQVSDRCETSEEVRDLLTRIADLSEFQQRCVLGVASGLAYPEIDGNTKRVDNELFRARRKLRAAA